VAHIGLPPPGTHSRRNSTSYQIPLGTWSPGSEMPLDLLRCPALGLQGRGIAYRRDPPAGVSLMDLMVQPSSTYPEIIDPDYQLRRHHELRPYLRSSRGTVCEIPPAPRPGRPRRVAQRHGPLIGVPPTEGADMDRRG
jgi:hypothetical protein